MRDRSHLDWKRMACRAVALGAAALVLGLTPRAARAQACVGDCNSDGSVDVTELIVMVNIALGSVQTSLCTNGDQNGDGTIDVSEIIAAVNNALGLMPCIPVSGGTPVCGNGIVEAGEDCDLGGICVGTPKAGTACTSEADCGATGGRCDGGTKAYNACNSDNDCGGGKCVKCQVFGGQEIPDSGGKTCTANCTFGTDILMTLVPGQTVGTDIQPETSGAVVYGDILTVPLALTGTQTFTAGRDRGDGIIPFTIRANSINFPEIPVSTIACACLRGLEAKTCGGTLFELDGVTQSTDCTEGYTAGASLCPVDKPCTFLHGPGNAGSGFVGCNGYSPVDLNFSQDSRGSLDPPECQTPGVGAPTCADPPVVTLSGTGGNGSIVLLTNNAIGTVVGACTGSSADYGPDGKFCTDDDPQSSRGTPAPQFFTTGSATGVVLNANGTDGSNIGPYTVSGTAGMCSTIAGGSLSGISVAGAFTSINQPTLGDIVVTDVLVAQ